MPEARLRNPDPSIEELTQAGKEYFDQTYGETARSTQALLSAIYPDLGASLAAVRFMTHTKVRSRLLRHQSCIWVWVFLYGSDFAHGDLICDDLSADRHRHTSTDRMALGGCDQEWRNEGGSESCSGHCDTNRGSCGRRLEARHSRPTVVDYRSRDLSAAVWHSNETDLASQQLLCV